jgi:hypothetical protein
VLNQLIAVGQLKIGEVEAWCDRAAHQAPAAITGRLGCKPLACGHHML